MQTDGYRCWPVPTGISDNLLTTRRPLLATGRDQPTVGATCEKCKASIEGGIAGESGIEEVTADTGMKRLRSAHDQERSSPEQLRARLREVGTPAAP
jgi:hypothetical protein